MRKRAVSFLRRSNHRRPIHLPGDADDFIMSVIADDDDVVAFFLQLPGDFVDFQHERTRRVHNLQPFPAGGLVNFRRRAVRPNQQNARANLFKRIHHADAGGVKLIDDMFIMHDFAEHVHRQIFLPRRFKGNPHRSLHARTKPRALCKMNIHDTIFNAKDARGAKDAKQLVFLRLRPLRPLRLLR